MLKEIELNDISNNNFNINRSCDSLSSLSESPSKRRNLLFKFFNTSDSNIINNKNIIIDNNNNYELTTIDEKIDNNENINTIDQNNNEKNTLTKILLFIKNKKVKSILILINHVLLQVSLISLLEPILYFNYILQIEEELFYNELDKIDNQLINIIPIDLTNNIRSQTFYTAFINFLLYENRNIDDTYNQLHYKAVRSNSLASKSLNKLLDKALRLSFIIISITIVYTIFIKYIYNKKIVKMLLHHIIFMLFIGLYELWFFINIASKYFPWNKDDIIFHIFKCSWSYLSDRYPELDSFEKNVTITC